MILRVWKQCESYFYDFYSHQISTQLDTCGRFWNHVLDSALYHIITSLIWLITTLHSLVFSISGKFGIFFWNRNSFGFEQYFGKQTDLCGMSQTSWGTDNEDLSNSQSQQTEKASSECICRSHCQTCLLTSLLVWYFSLAASIYLLTYLFVCLIAYNSVCVCAVCAKSANTSLTL